MTKIETSCLQDLKKMECEIKNYPNLEINHLPDWAGNVLKEAAKKLKDINFWISAGTALGLYRDGDFIKNDTDIDIAAEYFDGIEKEIKENLSGFEIAREIHCDGKPMQLAFMKDGVILDIYIHYPEGENLVNYSENGKQAMRADILRNLKKIKTKYGEFYFPNPIEEYLEKRYGDDWKIPQEKKPINYI